MSTNDDLTLSEVENRIDEQLADSYEQSLLEKFSENPFEIITYGLGILFFVYHLWYAYSIPIARGRHAIVHLGLVLMFWAGFRLVKADRSTLRGKLATIGYIGYMIATAIPIYSLYAKYRGLLISAGLYSDTEVLMGGTVLVLLLIALLFVSRLIFGVVSIGLVFSYFGPYMPFFLQHQGLSIRRIITMNTVEFQGVFGTLLQVVATWVVMFVLLSAVIEKYGGMAKFVKGVTRITARRRVQVGQVAVLSSMIFGSINGATTANVATTGSFTIPLMKQNGYPPRLAAALEAVASCGGQVLPPVMGTSAFIMAELIEPGYTEIVLSAIVPALLFYFSIFVSIELYTRKYGSTSNTLSDDLPKRSKRKKFTSLLGNYEYLAMFVVLIYWLVYIRSDPMLAAFYSISTLVGLHFVRAVHEGITGESNLRASLIRFGRENVEAAIRSAESVMGITIMVASLGIVVRAFIVTGLAQNLSTQLVLLAGGSIVLIILFSAVASMIFGMGMPTVAAYLLVALFVAPPLAKVVGAGPLAIHMFVFYFAIVSNITPPIAVAVVVGQGIAGSSFLETSVDALKMGSPMFVLPFLFLTSESLLQLSPMTGVTVIIVAVGFVALSIALIGLEGTTRPVRAGFLVMGLGAIFAPWIFLQGALVLVILASVAYHKPSILQNLRWRRPFTR